VEVAGIKTASTPFEGKFSTPFLVASALVHGAVRLNAYDPERLADPVVQALSRRVDLEIDPECAAAYPSQRAAKVTVELEDGRKLYRFQPTRKGDPDDPLSDAELSAKFIELASPVLGEAPAKQVLADLWACNQPHTLFAVPNQRTAAA
jgi:2-methylcitrate dehydratase PrpD